MKNRIEILILNLFLIGLALLSLWSLLAETWVNSHDVLRYPTLSYAFRDAFVNGVYYPRWLPDFCCGYGYPTFVLYPPGLFYLMLLFQFAFGNVLIAYKIGLFFLFYTAYLGVFCLTGTFTHDRKVRVLAVLLYFFTPYLYVNLYVRGDLAELASMLIGPWPLYFFARSHRIPSNHFLRKMSSLFLAALLLAAMVYTHPLTCIIFFPFFLLFGIALGAGSRSKKKRAEAVLYAVVAMTIALCVSSPYWLNAYLMKDCVHIQRALAGYFSPGNHFVYPGQLFSTFWGYGASVAGPDDGMSFQLGAVHFAAATLGVLCSYRNRKLLVIYCSYLLMILLMCPVSSFLWKHVPFISMLQFPWRILSVVAIAQVLCFLGVASCRNRSPIWLLVACVVFTLYWYSSQFFAEPVFSADMGTFDERTKLASSNFVTGTSYNEFLPLTAKTVRSVRGDAPIVQASQRECTVTPDTDCNKYSLSYTIKSQTPVSIRINQYYFPGWTVFVSGRRVPDGEIVKNLSVIGTMQLRLEGGTLQLQAHYGGPIGWKYACCSSVLSVLFFWAVVLRIHTKRRKNISEPM